MMVATVASKHDERQQQNIGTQPEENIAVCGSAFQHQRCLPGIVQDQAWKDDGEPGKFDRPPAEMAHIGIQRLGAGDAEKHRAQHQKAGGPMCEQVGQAVGRIECGEHRRMPHNARNPHCRDGNEPGQHHRAKQVTDRRRSL